MTSYDRLLRREQQRRWRERVMADPVRAARWRAQKRQWSRTHRARKGPLGTIRVLP